jgi:hypothetical protein
MSLKTWFIALFLCMLALSVVASVHTVKADSSSPIGFTGGLTLISPVNETYNSNYLTMNINLTCGAGIQFLLTYNIDGTIKGTIPLTYNGPGGFQLFAVETGTVQLPQLPDGTHQLTIYELASLNNYHGANPPGPPFQPTSPGSDNYSVSWTDAAYFSINATATQTTPTSTPTATPSAAPTTTPAASVPELPYCTLLIVVIFGILTAIALIFKKVGHLPKA